MLSVRGRLQFRTASWLTVIFIVAAGVLYVLIRAALMSEFDAALITEARTIASLSELQGQDLKVEIEPGELSGFSRRERPDYFQIWLRDGTIAARSPSLAGGDLIPVPLAKSVPNHFSIRLPDGRAGRGVAFTFEPRIEDDERGRTPVQTVTLAVARRTDELQRTLIRLGWLLIAVFTAATVAGVVVMGITIRLGLQPLENLAHSIEQVGVDDLSERIGADGTPAEFLPVVQRLNGLLSRLDATLAREKSFTADVAHELRTPLSGLQTVLEVCGSRERNVGEYQDVIAKSLRVTHGMREMVNNLLLLARADARQLTLQAQPVELAALIRECWDAFKNHAAKRHLNVQWELDSAGIVNVDADKLTIVLNNLFDNAVTYSDEGGPVRIAASVGDGGVLFRISNASAQFSAEDAPHVFDRFWRGDRARSDAGVHCGLGLSLCRKILEVQGGTIDVKSQGGNFTVTVDMPKSPFLLSPSKAK